MARRKYNEEDILRLLRETEVHLHGGRDVVSACHTAPSPTCLYKK
jgi:putative transposase